MSKGILVIEMPKSCRECKFIVEPRDYYNHCMIDFNIHMTEYMEFERNDNCPLIKQPQQSTPLSESVQEALNLIILKLNGFAMPKEIKRHLQTIKQHIQTQAGKIGELEESSKTQLDKANFEISKSSFQLNAIREVVDYIFIECGHLPKDLIRDEVLGKEWVKIQSILEESERSE